MALKEIKNVSTDVTLGLWSVEESLDELLSMADDSAIDCSFTKGIKSKIRIKQSISSRLLIKKMLPDLNASVTYNQFGKPILNDFAGHISISHSTNVVAVCINTRQETGIDVESISDKVLRIQSKFLSEKELSFVKPERQVESLITLWAAKESIYKAYGRKSLTFKSDMEIEPFSFTEKGRLTGRLLKGGLRKTYELAFEKLDNHILVYCVKDKID